VKNIALVTFDSSFEFNKIFEEKVRDKCTYHWVKLKEALHESNYNLSTIDAYSSSDKIDFYIFVGFSKKHLKFYIKNRLKPCDCVLIIREPKIIQPLPWKYLRILKHGFSKILTWDLSFVKSNKNAVFLPIFFFSTDQILNQTNEKNKFATLIVGKKSSSEKSELYSFRKKIINYYYKNNLIPELDLYGFGWGNKGEDIDVLSLYKGTVPNKNEILQNYYFSYCIENSTQPYYLSEKIFDSFLAGTIPIYKGDPLIHEQIPSNSFVNIDDFKTISDLHNYLKRLTKSELECYINNGKNFLLSREAQVFLYNYFINTIKSVIKIN